MSEKRKVLISTSSFGKIDDHPLVMLTEAGFEYTLNPYGRKLTPEESAELMVDIDAIIAGTEKMDRQLLSSLPRLMVISRVGTGMDAIDLKAAAELGIHVVNTPDAHVEAVAELTLAGILDLLRHIPQAERNLRAGTWRKPMGRLLRGKVIGIIGLGRVAKSLVKLLQPFDVTVLAYDPYQDAAFAEQYDIQYRELEAILPEADIVSLHLSYDKERYHFFGEKLLGQMKPDAILVNCARGGLVDEAALRAYLEAGKLAGAYLDTYEKEPYSGPLTTAENVLLTPHMGSYAAECRVRMETEAVENLLAFFND
ncbi:MAG: phosphoglycerate dehydrogenase [Candidatus Promineifilaceae bacterium]